MTLTEASKCIGAMVTYEPYRIPSLPKVREYGIIRSVNDTYVFVQYEGDSGPKATRPEDLTLVIR